MPSFASAAVLINEFLPNSVETDYEWIELYNSGPSPVNLLDYNISEEKASKNFTIGDVVINANGFIVLARNSTIFNQVYNLQGITVIEYGPSVPSLNLNVGNDSIYLYDNSGNIVDSIDNYADPGKDISIGRYPDGGPELLNILVQTPARRNDNYAPSLNSWIYPSQNNAAISGIVNIIVNITDDTTSVQYATINIDGTNYSMSQNGDLWTHSWNTNSNIPKSYNLTVFSADIYGKTGYGTIFNITLNNAIANVTTANNLPVITSANLTNADSLNRKNSNLQASWSYIDADNDMITANELIWYINGNENLAFRNLTKIGFEYLSKGQVWLFSVRIFDSKNWSDLYNSSALAIQNSAPSHSAPIISSNDYKNRKNSTLTCNNESTSDLDNDIVANFIKWYKNDFLIDSAVNSVALKPGNYSKNDEIVCEITPNDYFFNGTPLNSTRFVISNSAPKLVSIIPNKVWNQESSASIKLGDYFIDLDNDNVTYSYATISNIAVSIDDGIATLIPDAGFSGTMHLMFFASDGINTISSNNITLTVNSISSSVATKQEVSAKDEEVKSETSYVEEPDAMISVTGKVVEQERSNRKLIYSVTSIIVLVSASGAYLIFRKIRKNRTNFQ